MPVLKVLPKTVQTGDGLAKGPIAAKEIEHREEALANGSEAASDIVAVPGIVRNGAPAEPKPSGTAAAAALLRDALAQGPLDVNIIQRRAVDAGLLEENMPISKSKTFRSARVLLGVKSHQKPGRRAAGWVWSLPDQSAGSVTGVEAEHAIQAKA